MHIVRYIYHLYGALVGRMNIFKSKYCLCIYVVIIYKFKEWWKNGDE